MRPVGLTHDQAMACLKIKAKADAMVAVRKRATDGIKIPARRPSSSTARSMAESSAFDQLKAILDPLIKK